jgi:arylsulfatase A-like enzyme
MGLDYRTIGMIKWPGQIAPRVSSEMVSVHDWLPTLAGIIGAKVPTDRPIDGVDQGAFITGKQAKSNLSVRVPVWPVDGRRARL